LPEKQNSTFEKVQRQKENMAKYQNPLIIRLEVQLKYSET